MCKHRGILQLHERACVMGQSMYVCRDFSSYVGEYFPSPPRPPLFRLSNNFLTEILSTPQLADKVQELKQRSVARQHGGKEIEMLEEMSEAR